MAADDPLIGKKLGDYTIQGLLGRGGMSRVYRGYDENLARFAAVKVISGDFVTTTEEEYTRRFQSEARAVARLRHPNIVGIYQFGRTEGIYYMAQVFLEGKDLRTLLKDYGEKHQRMPHPEVVRIARDVGGALDYAHEQGVIHRDIKPSNIMLEKKSGRAILMDFGLALSVQEGTTGDTFGSAHYIAPEQAISSAKSVPQSDLYSLGIVLYEMITGRVPFDDPSVMSVALKHLNELPPPPTMFNPALPGAVEAVIMRALEKDPARRYPNCKELVDALEQAFQTVPAPPSAEVAPVSDLLDSQPRPPEQTPSWPRPPSDLHPPASRPASSTPVDEVQPGGLAGRFARRKAEKEEKAILSEINQGTFGLDNQEIDSLLSSMPDPREIGLVGPDARPITLPKKPAGLDLAEASAPRGRRRRRSRPGVVLPLLLILGIIAAGVWFGTQGGDEGKTTPTADGAVSGPQATHTPGLRATSTVPAAQATQTAAIAEALAEQTRQATTLTVPATGTAQPTRQPTSTRAAGSEPSTEIAEVVPPEASTEPAPPTEESSPESVPSEAPTSTPESSPAATQPANIRLVYDEEQFLLVNLSGSRLDVSRLVFEQTMPNGLVRSFEASLWDRDDIVDPPTRLRPGGCYQILIAEAEGALPPVGDCPQYLGYYQPTLIRSYFWLTDEPGAKFTVRNENDSLLLATCDIGRGECVFFAPPEALAAIPSRTPTRAPSRTPLPSLTRAPGAVLELHYDSDAFLLVNRSGRTLDISGLTFDQVSTDGLTRHFEARDWEGTGIVVPPTRMGNASCYQLVRAEAEQETPDRTVCPTFLGWFRTGVTGRYFWIAMQPEAAFTVSLDGSPVASCPISEGQCTVMLPIE